MSGTRVTPNVLVQQLRVAALRTGPATLSTSQQLMQRTSIVERLVVLAELLAQAREPRLFILRRVVGR